jgi:hypothetical protein
MLPTIRKVTSITKLEFTGNNKRIFFNFFKDLDELRNCRIWGIETYYSSTFESQARGTLRNDPDYNLPVITETQYQNGFLNLYDTDNINFLINAPLCIFGTIQSMPDSFGRIPAGIVERDAKSLNGQKIDMQNSNVVFNGTANTIKETKTIFMDIYYSRMDLDKVIINKIK